MNRKVLREWVRVRRLWVASLCLAMGLAGTLRGQKSDIVADLQEKAMAAGKADWGHWGPNPAKYSGWTSHSNRLIPIITFGIDLASWRDGGSPYQSAERLRQLYGTVPPETLNPEATYFDQTQVFDLQQHAAALGKKYIVLFVFDGMDWQTAQAAAVFRSGRVYGAGRGAGLAIQDYRGAVTDYGYFVSSPYASGAKSDVDAQVVRELSAGRGGYSSQRGGAFPWSQPREPEYLISRNRAMPHAYTDSASSATAMTSGVKTYNAAINVGPTGKQLEPIARRLQREQGFRVGVVTSVPISHATPAAAYANNVNRGDYQDLTRDLLGRPSVSHRSEPLPGVDVLIGAGWGESRDRDGGQGRNFVPGNRYLTDADLQAVDVRHGGPYRVAMRTKAQSGREVLSRAAAEAAKNGDRLLGFFGVSKGHLPFRTADGEFNPVRDAAGVEKYTLADVEENIELADAVDAALTVLGRDEQPFWLMIEAGDVDWANHANNVDNSIGAVLSGDAAFAKLVQWLAARKAWDDAAVIVTADHGHLFFLTDPSVLVKAHNGVMEAR